jgi:hypothetical protein
MRPLSIRQASSCENATSPKSKCQCRCGGEHHGSKRVAATADRTAYEDLAPHDPHHLHKTRASEKLRQKPFQLDPGERTA